MPILGSIALPKRIVDAYAPLEPKYEEAITRSLPHMPEHMARAVKELTSPEALSMMVGVGAIWAGSHFFGVGEIADAVLLAAGFVTMGASAYGIGRDLMKFVRDVNVAQFDADFEEAGKLFASIVTRVGADSVSALFFRAKPKLYGGKPNLGPTPPRGPGISYKPTTTLAPLPQTPGRRLLGITDSWGNITIHAPLINNPRQYLHTLMHERVHQFLTPKLHPLREIRVRLMSGGYKQSYLLRYLEEALAQTYANLKVPGVAGGLFEGITFPVKNGYVTLAKMGTEVLGHVMGSMNVGGMMYSVFLTEGPQAVRE